MEVVMKTVGIISEFNPFHNGHKYLIDTVKEKLNPDAIIILMSGNFVQRGEPSIIDKWTRSKVALLNGANLVLELPLPYSTQNADMFSKGAVYIFNKLNINYLCFGSETKDLDFLISVRDYIYTQEFKDNFSKYLNSGNSYPKSYDLSLKKHFNSDKVLKSNNILGLEYLKKLKDFNSNIIPYNIKRVGSDYKSTNIKGKYSSATALRKSLNQSHTSNIVESVPKESLLEINNFYDNYSRFNNLGLYFSSIKHIIIQKGPGYLEKIYDVSEGLHNRIYELIDSSTSIDDFIKNVSTKRYTYSKISRILNNILLDLRKDFYDNINIEDLSYLRVLSSDNKGFDFMKNNQSYHFITKYSDYKKINKSNTDTLVFNKTKKAGDIYFSSLMNTSFMNSEFTNNPYIKI
jgi:predicted nucleotidyltransferase